MASKRNGSTSGSDDSASPPNGQNAATETKQPTAFSKAWTNVLLKIRRPITDALLKITGSAARNPKTYVASIIVISIATVVIGLFTNFNVDVDQDTLWTPQNSRALSHGRWLDDEAGFPRTPRFFSITVHANGDNVLEQEGIARVFSAIDTVRNTPGYDKVCQQTLQTDFVDENGNITCNIISPTKFWNHSLSVFEKEIAQQDNETSAAVMNSAGTIASLSARTFPDETPVDPLVIYGNSNRDANDLLSFVQIYVVRIALPPVDDSKSFETDAVDAILDLDNMWEQETGNKFRVEVFAERSFEDEFGRAILNDIPLVPAVFVIMSIFTCLVFFRRDWVFSRSLLGFGAVVSVLLSIMTGYGLLFIIGVPFTSMTQILPFIMFGIGLDDAFIISGAYRRTDKDKDPVERVHDTIEEVGVSILVTTMTSVIAFALGCSSSIPSVLWLCLYAFPTIFLDFVYQITFFVALLVIDERRVQEKRKDCLVCFTVRDRLDDDEPEPQENILDRFMNWYSEFLMNPFVKAIVVVGFTGLFAVCIYSATLLEQRFNFTDVVPGDSYVKNFWDTFNAYAENSGVDPFVYFRNVDQTNETIQEQMIEYVDQLVDLDEITNPPVFFWLRDFKNFTMSNEQLESLPFHEQLDAFLDNSVYHELYNDHIVRDESGNVSVSRVRLVMDEVTSGEVTEQVAALRAQRRVGESQPINQENNDDWSFFTFDGVYYIWEFYAAAPNELTFSTILGVVTVCIIGMLFIPHWSAILFLLPVISILYVDLLGVLQFAGIAINAVSYIALVMSIGLLIDFLMHVLLRYYESVETTREGKVKDMLRTMGTSILVGGISTFLGVVPLAFSTSDIFFTIFVTFMGLVTLGLGHGLVLVPVLLSLFGPEVVIHTSTVAHHDAGKEVAGDEDKIVANDDGDLPQEA